MKNIIARHTHNIFLKPGEVILAHKPVLISTLLGSCVAVTMYEPVSGIGAICHAMLPKNPGQDDVFRYVDTALLEIYKKIIGFTSGRELVVKMFGGANVLNAFNGASKMLTIGEQNVLRADEVLKSMRLTLAARDVGGLRGRKLFFCTRSGDVYLQHMKIGKHLCDS